MERSDKKSKPKTKRANKSMNRIRQAFTPEQLRDMPQEEIARYMTEPEIRAGLLLANGSKLAEITAEVGVSAPAICEWQKSPLFVEFVAKETQNLFERLSKIGYGNKKRRIQKLSNLVDELEAATKTIVVDKSETTVDEDTVDKTKEIRGCLKDIASELGELNEGVNVNMAVRYVSHIERPDVPKPEKEKPVGVPDVPEVVEVKSE